jgi:hypothetical protein
VRGRTEREIAAHRRPLVSDEKLLLKKERGKVLVADTQNERNEVDL